MHLSNAYDSSLVFINPDVKEAQALKQRRVHLLYTLKSDEYIF